MPTSDTRTALLDSAQDLVQRVGVNAMSYNDLSVEVGIRKASIHYHFPHKDDLVKALLTRCGETYADRYRQVACSADPVMEKLQAIADLFEQSLREGKICTVGMLSVESQSLSDSVKSSIESATKSSISIIESIFMQGVADGTFPNNMDTGEASRTYHDFLLGAQIMARTLQDLDRFRKSAANYLRMLA